MPAANEGEHQRKFLQPVWVNFIACRNIAYFVSLDGLGATLVLACSTLPYLPGIM